MVLNRGTGVRAPNLSRCEWPTVSGQRNGPVLSALATTIEGGRKLAGSGCSELLRDGIRDDIQNGSGQDSRKTEHHPTSFPILVRAF